MNQPGELIDHLTLLLETSTGVVEVNLGLFESPTRWFVVQLGQNVVSGTPRGLSRKQIQEAMFDVGWPKMSPGAD